MTTHQQLIHELKQLATMDVPRTSKRRGIPGAKLIGVSTADIRKLAKRTPANQQLAEELWSSKFHEARLLAILVFPPSKVTTSQLNRWVKSIVSWGICDKFAKILASQASDIEGLTADWAAQEPLYVRRASLALIANHCMSNEDIDDERVDLFTSVIKTTSVDDRQHVKQACCWALRELGKVNDKLHDRALNVALELVESSDRASAWVGRCAHKELETLVKVPERRRLLSSKSKTGAKHLAR